MRVIWGALLGAVVLSGCATNRGEMRLDVAQSANGGAGRTAFVDEVVDARVFENEPSDPSVPSLKGKTGASADPAIKAKAIARKRNGFGQALGDIMLEDDQTVVGVTRDLLRAALASAGYRVVESRDQLGSDGIEVDARIEKFWGWFTPGFWSVTMEARIETPLVVTADGQQRELAIRAYGKNSGQSGREGNWVEAYRRTFEDYKAKAADAL